MSYFTHCFQAFGYQDREDWGSTAKYNIHLVSHFFNDLFSPVYLFLIFFIIFYLQLQLTHIIILVSGIHTSDQTLHNLLSDHPDKTHTHLMKQISVSNPPSERKAIMKSVKLKVLL